MKAVIAELPAVSLGPAAPRPPAAPLLLPSPSHLSFSLLIPSHSSPLPPPRGLFKPMTTRDTHFRVCVCVCAVVCSCCVCLCAVCCVPTPTHSAHSCCALCVLRVCVLCSCVLCVCACCVCLCAVCCAHSDRPFASTAHAMLTAPPVPLRCVYVARCVLTVQ